MAERDERERIPRTSDPAPPTDVRRERAQAVHSVDDETRMHTDADETELVQGAGGELYRPDAEERGGEAGNGDDVEAPLTDDDRSA